MTKIDDFIDACTDGGTIGYAECECGRIFYCEHILPNFLDEFEIKQIIDNSQNISSPHEAFSCVELEGRRYVGECNCYIDRLTTVQQFIDGHQKMILKYFKLQKQNLLKQAEDLDF